MIQRKQTLFLLLAVCALAMSFMFPIASFTAKAPLGIPVSGELNLIAKENPSLMNDILNGNAVTMGQKDYIKAHVEELIREYEQITNRIIEMLNDNG